MTKSIIWSSVGLGLSMHWAIICGWKNRIIAMQVHIGRQRHVGDLEFARGDALADDGADDLADQLDMRVADVPVLLHRDRDHLVQLGIADIALAVHAVDGRQQLAQPAGRRTGPRRDRLRRFLHLAHQQRAPRPDGSPSSNRRSDRRWPGSSAAPWRCRPRWSSDSRSRGTDAPPPRESALACRVRYGRKPASCQDSIYLNVQLFGRLGKRKCELLLALMLRRKIDSRRAPRSSRLLRNQRA